MKRKIIGLKSVFSGLGYSKFDKDKLSISKTILVKASDQSNKEKVNKMQNIHYHPKQRFVQTRSYVPKYRNNFCPTCFYCGLKCHTCNVCYVKIFSVLGDHYMRIKKRTNYQGPKHISYLTNHNLFCRYA